MFKKIFIAAIVSLLFIVGNQVNAMPASEMYLGGFTASYRGGNDIAAASYSEMVKVYGQPVQDEGHAEDNYTCRYGNSVRIGYSGYNNEISLITVTADNGWKTPSGLTVGMNISRATELYGTPDYTKVGATKTAYCYFGEVSYHNGQAYPKFGFIILFNNSSGKILQLEVAGGNSMSGFDDYYEYGMKRMVD